jgi:hypothetical protein
MTIGYAERCLRSIAAAHRMLGKWRRMLVADGFRIEEEAFGVKGCEPLLARQSR